MSRFSRFADVLDRNFCKYGLMRPASWDAVRQGKERALYAGEISRHLPQFVTHLGVTPFVSSSRNIQHDVRQPLPVPDNSIELYQSEDVFEHIPYDTVLAAIQEVYRVLQPGGLFRLSLPDYHAPALRDRSVRNQVGDIVFDPGGGGAFHDGQVLDGGHLWFPTQENVKALFDRSSFAPGNVRFLHYTTLEGRSVLEPIDYAKGHVQRTPDHDPRVQNPRTALSIVVDAVK